MAIFILLLKESMQTVLYDTILAIRCSMLFSSNFQFYLLLLISKVFATWWLTDILIQVLLRLHILHFKMLLSKYVFQVFTVSV